VTSPSASKIASRRHNGQRSAAADVIRAVRQNNTVRDVKPTVSASARAGKGAVSSSIT
jgi:hypothetical protein